MAFIPFSSLLPDGFSHALEDRLRRLWPESARPCPPRKTDPLPLLWPVRLDPAASRETRSRGCALLASAPLALGGGGGARPCPGHGLWGRDAAEQPSSP